MSGGSTPLAIAAERGDLRAVQDLLEAGDDIDAGGEEGTALWWAAARGHMKVAELLIEWGANLQALRSNYTPLKIASHCSMPEMAAMLERAVQQPLGRPQPERWSALGDDSVAFTGHYPQIQKRLTQIFNFSSRERLTIVENLNSRTDAMVPPTSFDDLPPSVLEKALDEFERQGGKADREYVLQGQKTLGKGRKMPGPDMTGGRTQ